MYDDDYKLYSVEVAVTKQEVYVSKRWAMNEEQAKAMVEYDMKTGVFSENPFGVENKVTMIATEVRDEDDLK